VRTRAIGGICLALLLAVFIGRQVWADDVTVTIGVSDTTATVGGLTSPGAFVTIKDNGSTVATTVADGTGNFSKQLLAQTPAIHDLAISSLSAAGRTSDDTRLSVSFAEHTDTPISVFLAPTLVVPESASSGSSLNIHGETIAGGIVQIYVDQKQPVQAYATADGTWSLNLPAGTLSAGSHKVFAIALDGFGRQSTPTAAHAFTITIPSARTFNALLARPTITVPVSLNPNAGTPAVPKPVQVQIQSSRQDSRTVGSQVIIIVQAQNGETPYDYLILWGDGNQDNIQSGHMSIRKSHIYVQPGRYHGLVKVTDAKGKTATNSFDVEVHAAAKKAGRDIAFFPWILIIILVIIVLVLWIWRRRTRRRRNTL
jgi:hypothetical protein